MAEREHYWKIRIEQTGKPNRFEYLTRTQVETRKRLGHLIPGVMSEVNAYVKIAPGNFQSLSDWKRDHRKH
ncbi:MAG: hypothetical protein PHX87_01850 [Candidatus Peribacteraceae bacterium]|nr:hypothetical protein [Candidatus Peribacteraceae bacterium]MDD5742150.1 hypothetical protein [Candidatus Peribacteraceae bacterium]